MIKAKNEVNRNKPCTYNVRALPVADWPISDREAWVAARRPGRRLVRGGAAGHLRASTAASMERAYGYLLDHLIRNGGLQSCDTGSACSAITPDTISSFIDELRMRVGSVTRHSYLQRIHQMAKILEPDGDWQWLNEMVLDLKDEARPRAKADRIVSSERLLQLGLDLIARADQSGNRTLLQRARLHRDGLMIALLALCPIRLGNLAELELGKHLVEEEGTWWIRLAASETKNGRPDERPLPPVLSWAINNWIEEWKPLFHQPTQRLWASTKGGGLAYTYVGTIITEVTRRELGQAVNPHLFRDCAVYTIAHHAGDEMGVASALLQHSDPRVTEEHYNRGSSIEAVKAFHGMLESLQQE
jgi:hypothetical protein